jgi:hypothetical protein
MAASTNMATRKTAAKAASTPDPKPAPRRNSGQFGPGNNANPKGRPKGSPSRLTLALAEERAKIADEAGCTPLQFLVSVYLDAEQDMELRERAAKDAAVYFHRKMPAVVEVAGQLGKQLDVSSIAALTPEDRKIFLALIERMGVSL